MVTNPRCRICKHDSRSAIETAILSGKAQRAIARDFHLGSTRTEQGHATFIPDHKIVARHTERCMPDAYQSAMSEAKTVHGAQIASRLRFLDECVDEVIAESRLGEPIMSEDGVPFLNADGSPMTRKNHRVLLAAVREARGNAEMLARLSGAAPEEDQEALDKARQALNDPVARRMLTDLEAHLATQDALTNTHD